MAVVAEQTDFGSKLALPTPDHPTYCVAYDGGYIEEGDPIANEKPAAPADVAQALRAALASQGYQPATAQIGPSLALVYHWGLLNHDSIQIRNGLRLPPNLKARIGLVGTSTRAGEIENFLLTRRMGRTNPEFRIPGFLSIQERDILDLAHDDRYFVIVTAYDYAALTHRETKQLWRVKMSTRSAGVAMVDALPAMMRGSASSIGRNLIDTQIVKTPLIRPGRVEIGTPKVEEFLPLADVAKQVDEHYLHALVEREHIKFSGVYSADDSEGKDPPASVTSG